MKQIIIKDSWSVTCKEGKHDCYAPSSTFCFLLMKEVSQALGAHLNHQAIVLGHFFFLNGAYSGSHLVRVQVWVLLTKSEQKRFWIPAQRLLGRDEIGPPNVETDPTRAGLVSLFGLGVWVALHREPKHWASPAAAGHSTGTELAAARRDHQSGRSQAHRAPDVTVLGLLYGTCTARLYDM